MSTNTPAYGLWSLVVINSAVFLNFAFSFTKPRTARDWRSFGAFSAFIVALFTEMYGFPLTIYLLSGWLAIMFGFLLQWPTLVTLVMFPVLVATYARLARREEQEARAAFGAEYERYAARTPAFFPRLASRTAGRPPSPSPGVSL